MHSLSNRRLSHCPGSDTENIVCAQPIFIIQFTCHFSAYPSRTVSDDSPISEMLRHHDRNRSILITLLDVCILRRWADLNITEHIKWKLFPSRWKLRSDSRSRMQSQILNEDAKLDHFQP